MTWKVGDVTREALVYLPATSGGKKSLSLDSTPRIHQGFAITVAERPSAVAASNAVRISNFICATL